MIFSLIAKKIQNEKDIIQVVQEVFVHLWIFRNYLYPENYKIMIHRSCQQKIDAYYQNSSKTTDRDNLHLLSEETKPKDTLDTSQAAKTS